MFSQMYLNGMVWGVSCWNRKPGRHCLVYCKPFPDFDFFLDFIDRESEITRYGSLRAKYKFVILFVENPCALR
jgi:hypothetical protein